MYMNMYFKILSEIESFLLFFPIVIWIESF